jgi:hypothetical protein
MIQLLWNFPMAIPLRFRTSIISYYGKTALISISKPTVERILDIFFLKQNNLTRTISAKMATPVQTNSGVLIRANPGAV